MDDFMEEVVRLVKERGRSWTELGEILGENPERIRSAWRRYEGTHTKRAEPQNESYREQRGEVRDQKALKNLIEQAIDGSLDSGELSKMSFWQVPYRDEESGDMESKVLWSAKLDVATRLDPQEIAQDALDDIRKYAPKYEKIKHSRKKTGWMYEIDIFDLHFGKYANSAETGGLDYNMDIAEEVFFAALDDLLGWVENFDLEYIVLPLGSDAIHIDTLTGTTTKGTPQDSHGTVRENFRRLRNIYCTAIDKLLLYAPVTCPVIPGNHGALAEFYLGELLSAWYRNTEFVTIDNSPRLRKYHQYGINLIGYSHGNEERESDLPMIMANEAPEMWGTSKIREWHLGHEHRGKATKYSPIVSTGGVTVRKISSVTPADGWHHKRGYVMGNGQAESFLWHRDTGMKANYKYNLLEL